MSKLMRFPRLRPARPFLSTRAVLVGVLLILTVDHLGTTHAQTLDPALKDFRPDGLVRFQNLEQARQRRQSLIEFIWPDGLPDARPQVEDLADPPAEFAQIQRQLISGMQRFTVRIDPFDFQSTVYFLEPTEEADASPRLAIVHAGHMPEGPEHALDAGLADTIALLLQHDWPVAVVQMPLVSWNHDHDGRLPNGRRFEIDGRGTRGHRELFDALAGEIHGQCFRFFLEPVVQTINEWEKRAETQSPAASGTRRQILMIGLSGGGWTTHMSAAVDPRIQVSIPVAGALPLYARPFSPGSAGDSEQEYAPLYGEEDSDDPDSIPDRATGVASWLEVFALGAIGTAEQPRTQIQVLNFYDSCCFSGPVYETYAEFLSQLVARTGSGTWEVAIDRSHRDHLISKPILEQVLAPRL